MFIGIFIVAIQGNWVILNYDAVDAYSHTAYYLFGTGIVAVLAAYMLNRTSTYQEAALSDQKDNREVINRIWKNGSKLMWIVAAALLIWVIVAFTNWSVAFQLLYFYLFIGMAVVGFLYVMQGDRIDEPEDAVYKPKVRKLLDLIDYRRHPFNLSFIQYILVVISFFWSKKYGIHFDLEVQGNPKYVTSLPSIAFVLSGTMLVSTFIYLIHHGDIFGIRKAEQNEEKVLLVHFMEIMSCGVTFFVWIMTVVQAVLW